MAQPATSRIALAVNGERTEMDVAPWTTLLDASATAST